MNLATRVLSPLGFDLVGEAIDEWLTLYAPLVAVGFQALLVSLVYLQLGIVSNQLLAGGVTATMGMSLYFLGHASGLNEGLDEALTARRAATEAALSLEVVGDAIETVCDRETCERIQEQADVNARTRVSELNEQLPDGMQLDIVGEDHLDGGEHD